MKTFLGATLCIMLLSACEQQEISETAFTSDSMLRVEAEVSGMQASRTATEGGKVTFAEKDVIGFYMPEAKQSGSWTYTDGAWTTDGNYSWPDKTTSYNFCAYYPFTKAESRDAITMPDLSKQNGTTHNLGEYDFLVARRSASYTTSQGAVSFTGAQAFKHVYALLAISLKTNTETSGSALTAISLKAKNLMTAHTYHFGTTSEEDGMTVTGGQVDEISLTDLDATILPAGYNQLFIVNPLESSESLTLAIHYTRGDEQFTASTTIPTAHLQEGNLNKVNVQIKKSGLVIQGNTVEDWTENNLDDVFVEESPETIP